MKKIFIILLAAAILLSSVSLAEDLSSMPDEELMELYRRVAEEVENRRTAAAEETPDGIGTAGETDESAGDRVAAFFYYWSQNRMDDMLALCASDWKAGNEDPRLELFKILANRTPVSVEVRAAYGESADPVRSVTAVALIDRNNGKEPAMYMFRITVKLEADGLWYIDPESLMNRETADGTPEPEQTPRPVEKTAGTPDNNTVLYYCPEGGQYYHADRNCKRVNEKYLPMNGMFTYAELNNEEYKGLQPCEVCGAPSRQGNRERTESFRDAVDAAGDTASVGIEIDYLAVAAEQDGKFIRKVTLPDDHARELYMAAMSADDPGDGFEAFNAYAWSLPVSYTEEITAIPKEQAELDAQAGKTVRELENEGYFVYGSGGGIDMPTIVDLSYGLFNYEFEAEASFEEYQAFADRDDLGSMKVKNGRLSGFSSLATDLDYLANGDYEPEVVPNVSERDEREVFSVPAEEYSRKAWPLTAEGYADLLDHKEARYGQVYVVEGTVHQVLSRNPMTVIIHTGGKGEPQPVVVTCTEDRGFTWEEGCYYRIYADVSSSCYRLPVLTARYMFSVAPADPEEEAPSAAADEFTAPAVVPAKEAGEFLGEWQFYRITNGDGRTVDREEMLANGYADDRAEMTITEDGIHLYTAALGEIGSVKYEFVPEDGTLRILNESDELPVLYLTDNGMLCFIEPDYISSGEMTAYLIRKEP